MQDDNANCSLKLIYLCNAKTKTVPSAFSELSTDEYVLYSRVGWIPFTSTKQLNKYEPRPCSLFHCLCHPSRAIVSDQKASQSLHPLDVTTGTRGVSLKRKSIEIFGCLDVLFCSSSHASRADGDNTHFTMITRSGSPTVFPLLFAIPLGSNHVVRILYTTLFTGRVRSRVIFHQPVRNRACSSPHNRFQNRFQPVFWFRSTACA